jgi:tripeptide aminopeptidase
MNNLPTVAQRFIRYAQIDTQSDPQATRFPSTEKQKDLSKLLVEELHSLGIKDAHMDEHGYVYATVPATSTKNIPTICYCSHVDTSPDVSGANVKPIVHYNYAGEHIHLPADRSQVIRPTEHPDLLDCIGHDIITADGTTLLGADNKAGVAVIMSTVEYLMHHPVKHGAIRVLFTPDEEVGRGTEFVDIKKLGAQYGYTVDAGRRGEIEDETFCADYAKLTVQGYSTHPGQGKNKLENAITLASEILTHIPLQLSPEGTSEREGFIHATDIRGNVESATVEFILRDFEESGLRAKERFLREAANTVMQRTQRASYTLEVKQQYRNMKQVLNDHPHVVEYAKEAMRRVGIEPKPDTIRGGTDGANLSFMGLPCPNIFCGEHAYHSKQEWVSVQDMEAAVKTLVALAQVWEEKS